MKKPKFKNAFVAYKKDGSLLLSWKDKRIVTVWSNDESGGIMSKRRLLPRVKER